MSLSLVLLGQRMSVRGNLTHCFMIIGRCSFFTVSCGFKGHALFCQFMVLKFAVCTLPFLLSESVCSQMVFWPCVCTGAKVTVTIRSISHDRALLCAQLSASGGGWAAALSPATPLPFLVWLLVVWKPLSPLSSPVGK